MMIMAIIITTAPAPGSGRNIRAFVLFRGGGAADRLRMEFLMTLLQDLKGLLNRRKPVAVDLTASQASNLTRHDTAIEAKPLGASSRNGEDDRRNQTIRPRAETPNLEEVMSMVRKISTHLETQTRRTDTLIECLEHLPGALDALPEINRQNSRLLEVISEYLDHAKRRDLALNDTLNGITSASSRQTEVLGLLQQQMDATNRSAEDLKTNLGGFKDAIRELAGSNRQTTTVLSEMNRTSAQRENELRDMLGRSQRWMIAAMICCAAASVTAVVVAGVALLGSL
jgi:hypothetical protein